MLYMSLLAGKARLSGKQFHRLGLYLVFAFCIGLLPTGAAAQQAGKKPPEQSLQAPFNDDRIPENQETSPLMELYSPNEGPRGSTRSLEKRHRTADQIAKWTAIAVSESLSFSPQNLESHERAVKALFSKRGHYQFQSYMERSRLLETMKKRNLRINALLDGSPVLVKEGVYKQGDRPRYRWVFEVPVMVSYAPARERRSGRNLSIKPNKWIVLADVVRMDDGRGAGEHNVALHSFDVRRP